MEDVPLTPYVLTEYGSGHIVRAYNTLDAGAFVEPTFSFMSRADATAILVSAPSSGMDGLIANVARMRGLLGIDAVENGVAAVLSVVGDFFDYPLENMALEGMRIPLPAVAAMHWCVHVRLMKKPPTRLVEKAQDWLAKLMAANCEIAFYFPTAPQQLHVEGAYRGSIDACFAIAEYHIRHNECDSRDDVGRLCLASIRRTMNREIPIWTPWVHILCRIAEFCFDGTPAYVDLGIKLTRMAARAGHGNIGRLGTILLDAYLRGHAECADAAYSFLSAAGKDSPLYARKYALCLYAGIGTAKRVAEAFELLHGMYCHDAHPVSACTCEWFTEGDGQAEGAGVVQPEETPEGQPDVEGN